MYDCTISGCSNATHLESSISAQQRRFAPADEDREPQLPSERLLPSSASTSNPLLPSDPLADSQASYRRRGRRIGSQLESRGSRAAGRPVSTRPASHDYHQALADRLGCSLLSPLGYRLLGTVRRTPRLPQPKGSALYLSQFNHDSTVSLPRLSHLTTSARSPRLPHLTTANSFRSPNSRRAS